MITVSDLTDLRAAVRNLRAAGATVGFVPTMGALHQGHLSLVRAAQRDGHKVVVSIFVNPTQFGPNEDFAKYPRTLEADLQLLEAQGTTVVFTPTTDVIYAPGEDLRIQLPGISAMLEGKTRPGHFDGVALVVTKLLNAVQCDAAYFGQKDFQQTVVIRRLVRDLLLPVEIHVEPTERETDGLAMSSRNRYLSTEHRALAPYFSQLLMQAATALRNGSSSEVAMLEFKRQLEQEVAFRLDYIEVVHGETLAPVHQAVQAEHPVVVAAVYLGGTRLIDNIPVFG